MNSLPAEVFEGSGSGVEDANISLSSTCPASTQEEVDNDGVLPHFAVLALRVSLVFFNSVFVPFSVLLNVLIIYLVIKIKSLRTASFCIAFQIAAADLCLAVIGTPVVVDLIAGLWTWGIHCCVATGFLTFLLGHVRIDLMCVFIFDCFANVFAPFAYPLISVKLTFLLSMISWIVSFTEAIILLPFILNCTELMKPLIYCAYSQSCYQKCEYFPHKIVFIHFLPDVLLPFWFFIAILLKGCRLQKLESYIIGVPSRDLVSPEWRSVRTLTLLLAMVVIVTVPPIVLVYLSAFVGSNFEVLVVKFSSLVFSVLVMVDAAVVLRNNDIKEALNRLISEWCITIFRTTQAGRDVNQGMGIADRMVQPEPARNQGDVLENLEMSEGDDDDDDEEIFVEAFQCHGEEPHHEGIRAGSGMEEEESGINVDADESFAEQVRDESGASGEQGQSGEQEDGGGSRIILEFCQNATGESHRDETGEEDEDQIENREIVEQVNGGGIRIIVTFHF